MNRGQLGQLLGLAGAMPGELRRVVTPAQAEARLADRLRRRNERLTDVLRRLVFAHPSSPYRALLVHAGFDVPRLARTITARGVDGTLAELRDAGVRISLEEFKGQVPIVRGDLRIAARPADFDSPLTPAGAVAGTTSGSRSAPSRVQYGWAFVTEEAENELLLAGVHGVTDADGALWYPALPGVAGVHNLLIQLKFGRPPVRWFSQTDPAGSASDRLDRLAGTGIRTIAALCGRRTPAPEFASLETADRVLDWIVSVRRSGRGCVLRGFASSVVRLARAARERGADLTGVVLFTGGEPLTGARARFIESTGARVFARYVATEPGLIGASCPERRSTDEMHVYTDRVALIPGRGRVPEPVPGSGPSPEDDAPGRLLLTTLSLHTGKVMLNTELGDAGRLARRACGCAFGRLGLDLFVSSVESPERLTLEGMTVPLSAIHGVIAGLVDAAGGAPDAWQCRATTAEDGIGRLTVAVSPDVTGLDAPAFLAAFHARLADAGPGLNVAADVWRRAGTVEIVRARPEATAGGKVPGLRRPAGAAR